MSVEFALKRVSWITIVAGTAALLVIKGCYQLYHPKSISPALERRGTDIYIPPTSPLREHLARLTVMKTTKPHQVKVPGVVEINPYLSVSLFPPLAGHLTHLNVQLNDYVRENQVLAVIVSPGLAQASAEEARAQSVLQLATHALTRAKDVFAAGGNSMKEVQIMEDNYNQALAEATRAHAQLDALSANQFSQLELTAPMNGYITALTYGQGAFITDPTVPMLTLTNLDRVWVTANIPEQLSAQVQAKQAVSITFPAQPEQKISADIRYVNVLLDPDTHRNKTRIDVDNRQLKLQPNQFATVTLSLPQPELISVPLSAVLMENETTSVFVETSPWVFTRRAVILGPEDGDNVRVLAGLNAGEHIVQYGGIFIND
jgi:cobalt-zinc-cadmium efflux system membrane fusion protein